MSLSSRASSSSSSASSCSFVITATNGIVVLATTFATGVMIGSFLTSKKRSSNDEAMKKNTFACAEQHLWEIVRHSFTGATLHAADKLGIFDILCKYHDGTSKQDTKQQGGGVSAKQIANDMNWSERWVLELLSQLASAGILTYHSSADSKEGEGTTGTFEMKSSHYAALLRDPDDSKKSVIGMFQFLLPLLNRSSAIVNAVKTGVGVDYEYGNDDSNNISLAIDRKNRNYFYDHLVNDVIKPTIVPYTGESLYDVLERGHGGDDSGNSCCNVADVGCGCGASTIAMAKQFPKCHFYAYESSKTALQVLERRIYEHNIHNITICNVNEGHNIGDGPSSSTKKQNDNSTTNNNNNNNKFTFIYCHDVLHDMTHPLDFMKQVRRSLDSQSGCWIIVDVPCYTDRGKNIQPGSGELLFGFSCLLCLQSATSSPLIVHDKQQQKDDEKQKEEQQQQQQQRGLGTCGFPSSLCEKWTKQVGFTHFESRCLPGFTMDSCFIIA